MDFKNFQIKQLLMVSSITKFVQVIDNFLASSVAVSYRIIGFDYNGLFQISDNGIHLCL